MAGTPARCVVVPDPASSLCIADSGAIVLAERPAGTVRATAHTTDIPDDAFDLPA